MHKTIASNSRRGRSDDLAFPVAGKRLLSLIVCGDDSGSMSEKGKRESLNYAGQSAVRHVNKLLKGREGIEVQLTVISFGEHAKVEVGPESVETVRWRDLTAAQGDTRLGPAISLMESTLSMQMEGVRGLRPVLALVSDGLVSDPQLALAAIKSLLASKWGKRAIRVGVGISGEGGECDTKVLEAFIGNPERPPLIATDAAQLGKYIDWTIQESTIESMVDEGLPQDYPPLLFAEDDNDEESEGDDEKDAEDSEN